VTLPRPDETASVPVIQYTYDSQHEHLYQSVIDPLGRTRTSNAFYTSPTDAPEKDGRLKSITTYVDATTAYQTTYDYDLAKKTILVTNPDGGHVKLRYQNQVLPPGDPNGAPILLASETSDVHSEDGIIKTQTTTYAYDSNLNVVGIGLPDPITGEAAPISANPLVCAPRTICTTYDAKGNRTKVTDPLGESVSTLYNAYSRPTKITNQLELSTNIHYDAHGNVEYADDSMGTLGGYTYDAHGNPETRYLGTDSSESTTYAYDQYGNITTESDALGHATQYDQYTIFGQPGVVRKTLDNGTLQVVQFQYDDLGRPKRSETPLSNGSTHAMTYEYDLNGSTLQEQNTTTGSATTYTYYYNQQVKTIARLDGSYQTYEYDWRGNVTNSIGSDGIETEYTYNLAGQQTHIVQRANTTTPATTEFIYDLAGRKITDIDSEGNRIEYDYDAGNRLRFTRQIAAASTQSSVLMAVQPLSVETEYRYRDDGRLEAIIDPSGTETRYFYDDRGFATSVTYAYGTATAKTAYREHDGLGRITAAIDPGNKRTTYDYDANGQLLSVTDPLNHVTQYTYTALGDFESITDAKGQVTRFEYDTSGRMIKKIWPDQSYESFTYDIFEPGTLPGTQNMRTTHRLPDGHINAVVYDPFERVIREEYFDGQSVRYT
jgi:YD repeat-containing protein